jgi:hypothetical protein
MSQPPLSYASPSPYPPGPTRPTMLTVLAILGIIFGSLGVLCVGLSDIIALFALASPAMARFGGGQSFMQRLVGLIIGLFGFALSAVLLWGSIGSLNLKPACRRMMISWSIADIVFDFVRMLFAVVILLTTTAHNPAFARNPAFQNNPNSQQMVAFAKVGGVVGAVATWLISTTFAVLVFIFFRKPEIIAAFENPPTSPNPSLPMPPM